MKLTSFGKLLVITFETYLYDKDQINFSNFKKELSNISAKELIQLARVFNDIFQKIKNYLESCPHPEINRQNVNNSYEKCTKCEGYRTINTEINEISSFGFNGWTDWRW